MARAPKETRAATAEELGITESEMLSWMLANALATAQTAQAHAALVAIESALIDLKARARSVGEHLGDYQPIIERIQAL